MANILLCYADTAPMCLQVMHALTSVYDRWRAKVHSMLSEANPDGPAAPHQALASASFRTQNPSAIAYTEMSALRDRDADIIMNVLGSNSTRTSSDLQKGSSASALTAIPKGIPRPEAWADTENEDIGSARPLQQTEEEEAKSAGFLKFVGEDEDNLALQKQREEEDRGENIEDALVHLAAMHSLTIMKGHND